MLFGIASSAANAGQDVELALTGIYDLPKAAGEITMGAALYFDSSTGNLSADHEAGPLVAAAVASASESAVSVRVRLKGVFGTASTEALEAVEAA